ncbi:MAG: chloramphenicol acetyltransferase [Candidatus Atribacteria bacterium]|nr:MAG: chloramphenicol acetyltransferase [Candidatus Atribacteria bacterium]
MKRDIDIEKWERRELFRFFKDFDEPYYGISIDLECTGAYHFAKSRGISFFLYYLYLVLKAVNLTEPFRYRIEGDELFLYDVVDGSATIDRENGTFGFSYMPYFEELEQFLESATLEVKRVRADQRLISNDFGQNIIHFSALPWIRFTSVSHPRHFSIRDSIPKITMGRYYMDGKRMMMPVSTYVHHALADGLHVGQFNEILQGLFMEKNG